MIYIPNYSYEYLINNNNTGIEYEYAIFYKLLSTSDQISFRRNVIAKHRKHFEINQVIQKLDASTLKQFVYNHFNGEPDKVSLTTQNDNVGPSDIVIHSNHDWLGLSIKYQNTCIANISSRYFITDEVRSSMKDKIFQMCTRYIDEMRSTYGSADNWFRKRKKSRVTDEAIDLLRDEVIANWRYMTDDHKYEITRMLFHADSPIRFWQITLKKKIRNIELDIDRTPFLPSDSIQVSLKKHKSSYVAFYANQKLIGKMQIKFNNGILEKGTKNDHKWCVDGKFIKQGDPFGSWNFNL